MLPLKQLTTRHSAGVDGFLADEFRGLLPQSVAVRGGNSMMSSYATAIAEACRNHSGLSAIFLWGNAAFAWNALGHKIVTEIAWRGLSPAQRLAIVETLKRHPRFADDFIGKMPAEIELVGESEKDHWIFLYAGYWPDIARSIPGDARSLLDRPTWHYVNGPIYLQPGDKAALAGKIAVNLAFDYPSILPESEWNIVQSIQHVRRILKDENALAAERAVAYCWLFHLVADAHQPMHSCALFSASRYPSGDRGGNDIPLRQGGNLHALWDNCPAVRIC